MAVLGLQNDRISLPGPTEDHLAPVVVEAGDILDRFSLTQIIAEVAIYAIALIQLALRAETKSSGK